MGFSYNKYIFKNHHFAKEMKSLTQVRDSIMQFEELVEKAQEDDIQFHLLIPKNKKKTAYLTKNRIKKIFKPQKSFDFDNFSNTRRRILRKILVSFHLAQKVSRERGRETDKISESKIMEKIMKKKEKTQIQYERFLKSLGSLQQIVMRQGFKQEKGCTLRIQIFYSLKYWKILNGLDPVNVPTSEQENIEQMSLADCDPSEWSISEVIN